MIKYKKKDTFDPVSINIEDVNLPKEQLIEKRSKIVSPEYLDFLYSQEGIRNQYKQSVKDVELVKNKIVEEGLKSVENKEDFEKAPWYANYEKNHPGEAKTCIGAQCDLANRAISKVNPKWKFPIQTSNSQFNQSVKEGNIPYEQIPLLETNKGDIIQEVLYKNGPPIHAMLSTFPMIYEETYPEYVDNGIKIKEQKLYRLPAISEGHKGPISLKNNKIFDDANAYRFVGDIPKLKKELETKQKTSFIGKKYL
jgi:hypothetical protein